MAIERTLSIIKPDAVAKNVIGQIYARFEGAGLKIVAAKMVHLSRAEACPKRARDVSKKWVKICQQSSQCSLISPRLPVDQLGHGWLSHPAGSTPLSLRAGPRTLSLKVLPIHNGSGPRASSTRIHTGQRTGSVAK